MRSIHDFVAEVRGTSLGDFERVHAHPYLVGSAEPMREVQQTRGLTVDRLIAEGSRVATAHVRDSFVVGAIVTRDLTTRPVTIGVSSSCDIVINDRSLSKQHARFDHDGIGWRIWDNDSSAGTRVNNEMVVPNTPRSVATGDSISLGYVDLTFLTASAFYRLVRGLFA